MIFLNVIHDANVSKEKVQKIANVIIAYGCYQREIKKKKMDKILTFLILFANNQIAKQKYEKRRKTLKTILFRLIQQQQLLFMSFDILFQEYF